MKFLSILFYFLLFVKPDLGELRKNYPKANDNMAIAQKMHDALSIISEDDKAILIAYKGGISALMAKHAKGIKEKKIFFKEGVELIERALAADNENLEIRCLRLGIQENSPKFLKYKNQIETDKEFILERFSLEKSEEIKIFVKAYILHSESFSEAEKQLF